MKYSVLIKKRLIHAPTFNILCGDEYELISGCVLSSKLKEFVCVCYDVGHMSSLPPTNFLFCEEIPNRTIVARVFTV